MKNIISLTIVLMIFTRCISQTLNNGNLKCLEGIWSNNSNNSNNIFSYRIITGNKMLSFGYEYGDSSLNFPLLIHVIGFQGKAEDEMDSLDKTQLVNFGLHYTEITEKDYKKKGNWAKNYFIPLKFGCENNEMTLLSGKLAEFSRLNKLSNESVSLLIARGKNDKRNYLTEFLKISLKEIKPLRSVIYSTPNTPTKMYLLKNDEVEILEEKGEWLMVRYYGNGATSRKTIEGWIKKSDIE